MATPKYRSGFERTVAKSLSQRKIKFKYEPCKLEYFLESTYTPDFLLPNGVYIECKGYLRPEDKRKLVAIKNQYDTKDLRILFMSKNKQYIKWAEKHGFKYAIGSIPTDWLSD